MNQIFCTQSKFFQCYLWSVIGSILCFPFRIFPKFDHLAIRAAEYSESKVDFDVNMEPLRMELPKHKYFVNLLFYGSFDVLLIEFFFLGAKMDGSTEVIRKKNKLQSTGPILI